MPRYQGGFETTQGLPVGNAELQLISGSSVVATITTASDGSFTFQNVTPGTYSVQISANGFQTTRTPPIPVVAGRTSQFQTAIAPIAAGLQQIANVVSSRQALQTTATINESLPPSLILDQNYTRAGDALATLPFVTSSTSSSLGDDESIRPRFRPYRKCNVARRASARAHRRAGRKCLRLSGRAILGLRQHQCHLRVRSGRTLRYSDARRRHRFSDDQSDPENTPDTDAGLRRLGQTDDRRKLDGHRGPLGYAFAYGVQGTNGELGPANILQSGLLNGGYNRCGSPHIRI